MKIAWFKEVISPEIGANLAGYSLNDVSVAKLDDLYATGLCVDDGKNKVLLISFDLLGLDGKFIRSVRRGCAEKLGVDESAVLLSCTHTHTGPETRTMTRHPEQLNQAYLDRLHRQIVGAAENLVGFKECEAYYYSSYCDENRNRRYITADACATFTPHRREVVPTATQFADKELGEICFFDVKTQVPLYVIGNYAAHPLAGHAPGLGGLRISADFPGAFRDYIKAETGAEAMFISGAAGDLVPKEDELGSDSMRAMGIRLGKAAIGGMIDSQRNPHRFRVADIVGSKLDTFTVPLRRKYAEKLDHEENDGSGTTTQEIQSVAIGDICFVGVPGELCCELGQEIKWHSPFRHSYIAYNSTAYFSYMGHANMVVQGGYEGTSQQFSARGGLVLLNTAAEQMFALREKMFPSEGEPYPDGNYAPLVNIPKN